MNRSTRLRVVAFAHVGLNGAHGSSAVFIFSRFAWDYLVSSVIGSVWRVGVGGERTQRTPLPGGEKKLPDVELNRQRRHPVTLLLLGLFPQF